MLSSLDVQRRYHALELEAATRRTFIGGGMGALAAAFLIACGDDKEEEAPENTTVTIDDVFGPVTVPTRPERVVAAESVTLSSMLALGFKPVAAGVNTNSLPAYYGDRMTGVTDVTAEGGGINLEKALSLNPDLLITSVGVTGGDLNRERYNLYQAAVPTFGYTHNYVFIEEIMANVNQVARVLGLENKAKELAADYEKRTTDLRERVSKADLTTKPVSTLRLSRNGNYSIRIGTSESIAFRALGIQQPEGQRNPEDFRIALSLERLNELNSADTLFVYVDDNAAAEYDTVTQNDVWRSLEPVKNGRVHRVNSGIWNSIDMVGLMLILDDIENMFIKPAEG